MELIDNSCARCATIGHHSQECKLKYNIDSYKISRLWRTVVKDTKETDKFFRGINTIFPVILLSI